jgi:hypothetical protein
MRDFDDSTLWKLSAFERMQAETGTSGYARLEPSTGLATSLMGELRQLERGRREGDAISVVAACVRQREDALLLLRHRGYVWPLTIFARHDLYQMPRDIVASLAYGNLDLQVLSVEPPGLRAPGHSDLERVAQPATYRPLGPLLWALALHAPGARLLDEIAGRVAYRLAAGFSAEENTLRGALGPALRRLRRESASLNEIAHWPGLDHERAVRLLNGVYLQGGLMVLRANHAAAAGGLKRLRSWLLPPH